MMPQRGMHVRVLVQPVDSFIITLNVVLIVVGVVMILTFIVAHVVVLIHAVVMVHVVVLIDLFLAEGPSDVRGVFRSVVVFSTMSFLLILLSSIMIVLVTVLQDLVVLLSKPFLAVALVIPNLQVVLARLQRDVGPGVLVLFLMLFLVKTRLHPCVVVRGKPLKLFVVDLTVHIVGFLDVVSDGDTV